MYYLVYLTTNKTNGKIYVGVHRTHALNDGYIGSGLNIQRAIKKYGWNNFDCQILYYCLEEAHAFAIESQIVDASFVSRPDTYNIVVGGLGGDKFTLNPNKEGIREQMVERMSKSNPMLGRKHSEESKQQISNNKQGVKRTTPVWNVGISPTAETTAKQQETRRGNAELLYQTYLFLSPTGEEFLVHGAFNSFCKEHNLTPMTARWYIGKGVIPPAFGKGKSNPKRHYLEGWTISTI